MKLFKKFLLAAGLVGLVGSFGFATQAKATGTTEVDPESAEKVVLTIDNLDTTTNTLTWHWDPDSTSTADESLVGSIYVYIGSNSTPITVPIPEKMKAKSDPYVESGDITSATVNIDDYLKGSSYTATVKGAVKIKLAPGAKCGQDAADDAYSSESVPSAQNITPWHYVQVVSDDIDEGTVTAINTTTKKPIAINGSLVKEGDAISVTADPEDGYTFENWIIYGDVSASKKKAEQTIYAFDSFKATATFSSNIGPIGGYAVLNYVLRDENGNLVDADYVQMVGDTIPAKKGYSITFTPEGGDVYNWSSSKEVKLSSLTVNSFESGKNYTFYTKSTTAGLNDSAKLVIAVEASEIKETKISIEGEKYMTAGYEIELNTKIDTEGTYYKNDVEWEITDGKAELSTKTTKYDKDKKEKVKVKFTGDTPDAGKTATIKLRARIPKAKNGVDPAEATYEITVYPKTTMSYSTSDRTLSYKGPAKVNTGTTDGQDSDNKDNTKTAIDSIGGIVIQVFSGDTSLGRTTSTKSNGASATISASTVEQMVYNLSSKLSGDSPSIKFRGFSCANDSNATYNKNVYADATTTAYRVEISYTKADGTSATEVVYGLEGQSIDITKISALKNATIQGEDGKSVTTIKVSSSPSNNRYTAVLGERKSASDGEGLDRVPKTGQNNAFVYVMVAIVACAVCGGLYAYNKKSKNL